MKKVCAWCSTNLEPASAPSNDGLAPISHGICAQCVREVLYEFNSKSYRQFLSQFDKPVFVVDSIGRVLSGNDSALGFLSKTHEEISGKLGGEVFECIHAQTPEGCGETTHCKTCTIRNSVMKTLKTGVPQEKIPAYPDLCHLTGEKKIRFLISTERIAEMVLLRIDEIDEIDEEFRS